MKMRALVCTSSSTIEIEALAKMLTAKTGIAHYIDSYALEKCNGEIIQRYFVFKIINIDKKEVL